MSEKLYQTDEFPPELLTAPLTDLNQILKGPTLIHLEGGRNPPLFVCVLLHGNEHTGFLAIQRLLKKYLPTGKKLPRSLSLFVGNVQAASQGLRKLENQADFNRVWLDANTPEGEIAQRVIEIMKGKGMFASIDVHNNTGKNPHYACVSRIDPRHLHLATLFQRTVVYYTSPPGTQSVVFSGFTPAITIECGLSGDSLGVDHATDFFDASLHLSEIPSHPVAPRDIDFFETVARVRVPDDLTFTYANEKDIERADIVFREDLDTLNFSELPSGTSLGKIKPDLTTHLLIDDPQGRLLEGDFIDYQDGLMVTKQTIIPSMFTHNKRVIREDCLGYLMQRKKI